MGTEMDTYSARLASFDIVLRPDKRRSSNSKGPNAIAWPHESPSPEELAQAGFYYKPYESNPDNTTCFHCHRALDGWEEEDNPITEHLKHAPDCGWAVMMDIQQRSSNPKKIEDPMSERIAQARAATFGTSWPHDGKKGWVCQSEKMVESGWYFCPNEDSDDLASCAYCKLSLDGWEPKDDPYDEHFRRSSYCSFFVFAQPPQKGKGSRTKKSRTSKASSRLSTQSVATTASEAPEFDTDMDMDDEVNQSIMSQTTTKTKSAKRGPKGKGKSAKAKKQAEEVEAQMDVDNVDHVQPEPEYEPEPEPPKPKRVGRGKKRVSEDINNDDPEPVTTQEREQSPAAEPPSKRRATGTRSSSVSRSYNYDSRDHEIQDADSVDEAAPKKRGRKPKKATSKGRKASDVSTSSKAPTKERLPRDSEIDAVIQADLDADADEPAAQEPEPQVETEQEPMQDENEPEPEPAPGVLKKSKSTKKSKATEKAFETEEVDAQIEEYDEHVGDYAEADTVEVEEVEELAPKKKSSKSSKKKGPKKSKKEEDIKAEKKALQNFKEPTPIDDDMSEYEHHDSLVSVEALHQNPEPEADAVSEAEEKPVKKSSKKKDEKPKKSKKSKKEPSPTPEPVVEPEPEPEPEVEDEPELESEFEAEAELLSEPEPIYEQHDTRSPSMDIDEFGTPGDIPDQVEMVPSPQPPSSEIRKERTPVPPKTTKRFSDIPQEEHLAESFSESQRSRDGGKRETKPQMVSKSSNRAVSPLPPPHQSTPSLSPQSSDAENRPPSSRPALSSTPRQQTTQVLLAAATPSPSKRNPNAGFPASAHPWTPVDIDEILYGEASDKENADLSGIFKDIKAGLTSPEKKMSVEQWILWNAKNGEDRLKRECERLVSQFEKEGGRAMQRLEAIECMD